MRRIAHEVPPDRALREKAPIAAKLVCVTPWWPEKGIVMPARRLIEFLDGKKVRYVKILHSLTYTVQEIAVSARAPQ